MMKYCIIVWVCCVGLSVAAQDVNVLIKEASNLEKQLKEADAYKKYEQVTVLDAKNITALVKCAEINCAMGMRQKEEAAKANYYSAAHKFALQAYAVDSNNADACYAIAMVSGKMTEVADDNRQILAYARDTKKYAEKAIRLNPDHAKANYTLGKWHLEMDNLSWIKKAAAKAIKGGLPKADIDSAVYYMEQCRKLDMYFVRNYLDLAKAYESKSRPMQEMDVLNKLVKLPNRTPDDAALKEEGRQMLAKIQ
ncbi:hypothetical protein I5907_01075 [Panacibacter sp. DH6]|uniref:Regulator of microtubule dynamics protein 1 n=1 Tax=Panacibacter microcysteis TaxID=2793269 RepID=A0A931E3W2_9BACT|nr:hypothetical protein [Panacibacter microcysteis]MBG9374810.1 hypothetical protein [Panacibacter microcysteis]